MGNDEVVGEGGGKGRKQTGSEGLVRSNLPGTLQMLPDLLPK